MDQNFAHQLSTADTSLTAYPLWVADPTGNVDSTPNIGSWSNYTFMQYDQSGTIAGITGQVDRDVFNSQTGNSNSSIGSLAGYEVTPINSVNLVDFENTPVITGAPDLFDDAGVMQTIVVPGVATFTGGVVLGNPTHAPALAYATPPNAYGTASQGAADADPSLTPQITIAVAANYPVNEVSFTLLNGETSSQSFTATAYAGSQQVA